MKNSRVKLILSMVIFGTIGLVRVHIPYSSGMLAFMRAFIGVLFLIVIRKMQGKAFSKEQIKKNFLSLCISGILLGFNWILLFEAYRFTAVSVATICYYMAPVFVILISPIIFLEKLTIKKIGCSTVAVFGMVLVSDVLRTGLHGIKGVLFGLGAALFYAAVIIINKKMDGMENDDRTIVQLGIAAIALLPYVLLTEDFGAMTIQTSSIVMLLIAGIVHTGIAYALYFGSIRQVPAQTIALFSYIDPITAVILSVLVLKEEITLSIMIGIVLVIGSTLIGTHQKKETREL